MNFKSQIGQDRFVCEALKNKINGYYIDIGAAHPEDINNTFYLEKELGWDGLSIDMGPDNEFCHIESGTTKEQFLEIWRTNRTGKFICDNALNLNYRQLFKKNSVPKIVDYLSIDLEPASTTYECLLKIPFEEYQFRVVTFEHDLYRDPKKNIEYLEGARAFLKQFNLMPLDVRRSLKNSGYDTDKISVQEDWFLNTKFFKEETGKVK